MYKLKQKEFLVYQLSVQFFSLSAKKLLVGRQTLNITTEAPCVTSFALKFLLKRRMKTSMRRNKKKVFATKRRECQKYMLLVSYSGLMHVTGISLAGFEKVSRKLQLITVFKGTHILQNVLNWAHCLVFLEKMTLWFI